MYTTHDTRDDTTDEQHSSSLDESLPPFVAFQVEEESRENAPSSSGSAGDHYRHGRVEAETHRISEEVTREAQERLRDAQATPRVSAHAHVSPVPSMATITPMAPAARHETSIPAPTMVRRILAPLDGTLQGERVFPYVAEFARLSGAHVLLAHVTPNEPLAPLGRLLHLEGSKREDALRAFAPEALYYLRYVQK